MSHIFSKLLDEGDKQRQQLDSLPAHDPKDVFSQHHPSPTARGQETDLPTLRQDVETTKRPSDDPTVIQSDTVTERRSDLPTIRRSTERIAFDLFTEQVQAIRRLRAQRELNGSKRVSLSDIAREAMDLYLRDVHQHDA